MKKLLHNCKSFDTNVKTLRSFGLGLYENKHMKYTSYFSNMIKINGNPNVSADEMRRWMNLIHLEGKLAGIDEVKKKFQNIDGEHRYEMIKITIIEQIQKISLGLPPEQLIQINND